MEEVQKAIEESIKNDFDLNKPIYSQTTQLEQQLYNMPLAMPREIKTKTIYEIPVELYDKIPEIVEINNKKFYKTDINEINQTRFKLIEM